MFHEATYLIAVYFVGQRDAVAMAFAVVLGVVCLLLILFIAALIYLYKITPRGIKNR